MRYRPYNQPPEYYPQQYHHYPYTNQTIYPIQQQYPTINWKGLEVNQSPFEHFAKPALPAEWTNELQNNGEYGYTEGPLPLPNTDPQAGLQQGGGGQMDFDKMLSTVGQLASTYHQVSPIVKQFSTFIKSFR